MGTALEYRLFLNRPNKEELCEIVYKNLSFSQRFGDFNTLSFDVPYYENGWELKKDERFDLVDGLYLVKLSIYKDSVSKYDEYFVITNPNSSYDGNVSKTVSCYPMEHIPFKRRLRNYEKKTVLYDALHPTDPSAGLLNYICIKILYGTWTVAYISPSIASISRTWSYSSSSLTEAFKDVEKQLDCYIRFDNVLNTISVYSTDEFGTDIDLILSDSNYITRLSKDDKITDIITRVNCYGKNNITVSAYNPTGLPYVDNFSYVINSGRMSADLVAALWTYQTITDQKTIEYDAHMVDRAVYVDNLALARAQRTALNEDLDIIEDDLDILKDEHPTETAAYTSRYADKVAKEAAITAKTSEIEGIEDAISVIDAAIAVINQALSFEGHFTLAQLQELNGFILEEDVPLDTITDSHLLYEYAKAYIEKKATPSAELTVNLIDLLSDSEQEPDWEKVIHGCGNYVLVDCADIGLNYHRTKIIQIDHNPTVNTLSAVLSNSDKIKKAINFMATEVWQKSRQAALKIEVNQYDYKSYVTEKATLIRTGNNIDASTTPITAGNVKLNRRGLLGSNIGSNGALQMLKDKIIISNDNFQKYNTILSGNGLYLERADKKSRIVIDVNFGIQVDVNIGTTEVPIWNNELYYDPLTSHLLYDGRLSVNATAGLATTLGVTEAVAQVLVDAKAYSDSVEASIMETVEATYETISAVAGLVLEVKAYTDGQVSSARAELSAGINDVAASLELYVEETAPGQFQSKAELSADIVNILSDLFSIIGSGGVAKIVNGQFFGSRFYAGDPSAALGYTVMTEDGLEVYNTSGQLKSKLGYTSDGYDYPFLSLGSGTGAAASKGLIKKFSNGLWMGNSAPEAVNGAFVPQAGYSGFFVNTTDHKVYVVDGTNMQNVYTGYAIAKFGG